MQTRSRLRLTTFPRIYEVICSYRISIGPFCIFLKLIVSVLPPLLFFGKDLAITGSALSSLFKVYNPSKA